VMYLGSRPPGPSLAGQAVNKILHVGIRGAPPSAIVIFGIADRVIATLGYRLDSHLLGPDRDGVTGRLGFHLPRGSGCS